ncbi:response regulator [Bradyrhizobium sp. URHD0069]|uniref:response regulator n=1 Tax=Bradyrhizobium sp. URHD0069 TaxID=1380355 RepID=UPI00068E0CF8|nr:response regulator [Bradyrhizobium sp. URHD0069]
MSLPEADKEARSQLCVLVIEDEYSIRSAIADELRAAGLQVVEATNANEAMDYLNSTGRVDLVFTDVNMPGAIDGLELARWTKARRPDVPIFITSGTHSASAAAGLGRFLPKPYSFDAVVLLILQTLTPSS